MKNTETQKTEARMNRQATHTEIKNLNRSRAAVRMHGNGFAVTTDAINKNGEFETDSLKNREYRFVGNSPFLGIKKWFKIFVTEDAAEKELEIITQ